MCIIDALRTWFASYPLLKDGLLNVERLGAEPVDYTIDSDQPESIVLRQYTDGGSLRQFPFVFASMESYGVDTMKNIENSGFYEALADWVEQQSDAGNLPVLDDQRKIPEYIEVLSGGYPFDVGDSTARYQIAMNFVYYQKPTYHF